jgi:hypothetical protein
MHACLCCYVQPTSQHGSCQADTMFMLDAAGCGSQHQTLVGGLAAVEYTAAQQLILQILQCCS